jgi:hypothetical protein
MSYPRPSLQYLWLILLTWMLVGCDQKDPHISTLSGPTIPNHQGALTLVDSGNVPARQCKPAQGKLARGSCEESFLCVPNALSPTQGTCLTECGQKQGNTLVKRQDACSSGDKCMLLRGGDMTPVGMFCLPQQKYLNLACEAPFDDNACANGATCLPTQSFNDQGRTFFTRYQCKQECSKEQPCMGAHEECLIPSYARHMGQKGQDGKLIRCDVKKCHDKDPTCSCDASLDYYCEPEMPGLNSGICQRPLGICGEPVSLAHIKDFHKNTYLAETCNELTDNRICKNPDPEVLAKPMCRLVSRTKEGICIAPCSSPSIDRNLDGVITNGEKSVSLRCPAGYSCRTDIARKLSLFVWVEKNGAKKICNPNNCPRELPCPTECGPGMAECLSVGKGAEQQFFCGAPIGTCLSDF